MQFEYFCKYLRFILFLYFYLLTRDGNVKLPCSFDIGVNIIFTNLKENFVSFHLLETSTFSLNKFNFR